MKYGILDRDCNKVVSWYVGNRISRKSPFADTIRFFHFEMTEQYPEAYSMIEGNLNYDFEYVPPQPDYLVAKLVELESIRENFKSFTLQFAADNSKILNIEIARKIGLFMVNPADEDGLNPADLGAFVRGKLDPLVDAMKPVFEDIQMNYFWRVEEGIAAIPREPLLASDERLAQYQTDLIAIVRP